MYKQLLFIGLTWCFCNVSFGQFSWQIQSNMSAGYINNIYLSPAAYQLNDTSTIYDYRINRSYNRISINNTFSYQIKKKHKLSLISLVQPKMVWHEKAANAHIYQSEFSYAYTSKKISVEQRLLIDKERKLTIDVLNDDGISAYDYLLKQSSSYVKFKFSPKFYVDYNLSLGYKKYQLMPSGLDFTHFFQTHYFSGNLKWNNTNFLQYGIRIHQQYFNAIFVDQTTSAINWRYFTNNLSYKWKKDKDHYINCQFTWLYKSDFRKSDYSFHQFTFSTNGETKWNRFGFTAGFNYSFRNYLDRVSYNYNIPSPLLKYQYIGGNMALKYYFPHALELTLGVSGELRFSNSNRLDRKYRRPYETSSAYLMIAHSFKSKPKTNSK